MKSTKQGCLELLGLLWLRGGQARVADKDTVFPVCQGPAQHHLPGQLLHQSLLGSQALPPLPGPLPVTEVYLEHGDTVESRRHLCNRETA
jgi:hypothetical protein